MCRYIHDHIFIKDPIGVHPISKAVINIYLKIPDIFHYIYIAVCGFLLLTIQHLHVCILKRTNKNGVPS